MISSSLSTAPSISTTSTAAPYQSSEYEASSTPNSEASFSALGVHAMVEPWVRVALGLGLGLGVGVKG